MGFFWGVDQDSIVDLLKKLFFDQVRTQKPGKSPLSVLVHDRNRSGVVELVGREPWIIARVENGVTRDKIFAAKTVKRQNFQKKFGSGKQFSVGNFHFFGRGKTNFWGGITSKLASQ